MSHWHELSRYRGGLGRYSSKQDARQIVLRCEQNLDIFEAHFERKEVEERTERPEGWIELWPLEPITGETPQDAMDKALPLLEVVTSRCHEELFEKRPCPVPLRRKKVAEVQSPTHRALAWICKHFESLYEVRYFGDIVGEDYGETGWRLDVPSVESMPVPKGFEMLTYADSLESAKEIALLELEQIAASGGVLPRECGKIIGPC